MSETVDYLLKDSSAGWGHLIPKRLRVIKVGGPMRHCFLYLCWQIAFCQICQGSHNSRVISDEPPVIPAETQENPGKCDLGVLLTERMCVNVLLCIQTGDKLKEKLVQV